MYGTRARKHARTRTPTLNFGELIVVCAGSRVAFRIRDRFKSFFFSKKNFLYENIFYKFFFYKKIFIKIFFLNFFFIKNFLYKKFFYKIKFFQDVFLLNQLIHSIDSARV